MHVWERERKGSYRVLVGNTEGKRPLGRPRRRWEDNIKMELEEVAWGHGLDRPDSEEGQVVGLCECGNKPSVSTKCWEILSSWEPVIV